MPWIALAIGGSALVGGLLGADASKSAASTQANAANQASQLQYQAFKDTQALEQPFVQGGYNALAALDYGLGLPVVGGQAQGGGLGPGAAGGGTPALQAPTAGSPNWGALLQARPDVMAEAQRVTKDGEFPSFDAYAQWWYQNYGQPSGYQVPTWTPDAISQAFPGSTPAGGTVGGAAPPGAPEAGSLAKAFNIQPFDYKSSPGYQFELGQGLDAVTNRASAAGGVASGNTLKAITGYAEGLASTDYGNMFNQYLQQNQLGLGAQQQQFNQLAQLAGSGQNAAANLGSAAGQTASTVGNLITGGANATAAGQVGSVNALTGAANSGISNYLLSRFLATPAPTPPPSTAGAFQASDFAGMG